MSFPITEVRCTGCSFSGVMTPRPVVVKYQLPDGRTVNGGRRFVICFNCDAITEAEMLPSLGDIELEERSTAPNLFTRLLSWLSYSRRKPAETHGDLQATRDFLKLRRGAPRCLRCGGTNWQKRDFTAGVIHSCGGRLHELPSDENALQFHYASTTILLDVEGLPILGGYIMR